MEEIPETVATIIPMIAPKERPDLPPLGESEGASEVGIELGTADAVMLGPMVGRVVGLPTSVLETAVLLDGRAVLDKTGTPRKAAMPRIEMCCRTASQTP